MNGYTEDKRVGAYALSAFCAANLLLFGVNEPRIGFYRCHEIARFVYRYMARYDHMFGQYGARVVDGTFAGVEHSWIELKHRMILDVYSVARVPMVQLVDLDALTLMRGLFREQESRTDIREDVIEQLFEQTRADEWYAGQTQKNQPTASSSTAKRSVGKRSARAGSKRSTKPRPKP